MQCLMNLTEEQIKLIGEMSEALLPAEEIAILLKIPVADRDLFVQITKNHKADPIYEAFHFGRLSTKLALRKTVIKLAKNGSPAAEPIAEKYIREQIS